MINTHGKIFKRRKRIVNALRNNPKPLKTLAKELGISNTLMKSDINYLIVERKVQYKPNTRLLEVIECI